MYEKPDKVIIVNADTVVNIQDKTEFEQGMKEFSNTMKKIKIK